MPTIMFEPTGVDAGWEFSLEGEAPPDALDTGPSLSWAVRVGGDDTVRLASGGTLEMLPGRVAFSVGAATPAGREVHGEGKAPIWGTLMHRKEDTNPDHFLMLPEAYTLRMHVSRSMYETLRSLIAARTLPTITVTVGSNWTSSYNSDEPEPPDNDAIKYGWEPDGRGLEWDNEHFRQLEIKWCEFRVDVGLPKSEEDEAQPDRGMLPPTKGDLAKVLESLTLSVRRIEQLGRAVTVPLWIAVVLLGILAFRR